MCRHFLLRSPSKGALHDKKIEYLNTEKFFFILGHLLKLALVVLGEVANILLQRVDVLAQAVLLRPRLLVHLLDLLHVLVVLEAQLVGALCLTLLNLLLQLRNQTCKQFSQDVKVITLAYG